MLFNLNVLMIAPLIKPVEKSKPLKSLIRQQGSMITSFNKMLNCSRPDKFKVAYDQRQIDIANGATDLPPLKQI